MVAKCSGPNCSSVVAVCSILWLLVGTLVLIITDTCDRYRRSQPRVESSTSPIHLTDVRGMDSHGRITHGQQQDRYRRQQHQNDMSEQEINQQATAGLQLPHMPQQRLRRPRTRGQARSPSNGQAQAQTKRRAAPLRLKRGDYYHDQIDEEGDNPTQQAFSGMHPARAREKYRVQARRDNEHDSNYDNDVTGIQEDQQPTIRILLVSDIDLPSSSALAEYALLQNDKVFDASRIDICIACGPFCRDEDLMPYLKGKQRRQQQQQLHDERKTQQTLPSTTSNLPSSSWSSVFFRTPEETAALEGLLTAAISQLENIVCRVVFCPGSTDPITNTFGKDGKNSDLRFTPNSRNIHQRWLPLAPGLGCAGLLFLDTPSGTPATGIQIKAPRRPPARQTPDDSDDEQDAGDDYEGGQVFPEDPVTLTNVYGNKRMGAKNYCQTLERLVKLAPPSHQQQNVVLLNTRLAQTILVTHYFQPPPPLKDTQEKRYINNYSDDDTEAEHTTTFISSTEDAEDNKKTSESLESCKHVSPWPRLEHKNFVESDIAQEQLALEIASGCGATQTPRSIQIGKVHLIIPGSLRERGEFCLIDISLMEGTKEPTPPLAAKPKRASPNASKSAAAQFAWRVANVEFHNMNRLP